MANCVNLQDCIFFTIISIPSYFLLQNGEMGFAIAFQVFLPFAIVIVLLYLFLKFIAIRLIGR